jgi:hypothetical protein
MSTAYILLIITRFTLGCFGVVQSSTEFSSYETCQEAKALIESKGIQKSILLMECVKK